MKATASFGKSGKFLHLSLAPKLKSIHADVKKKASNISHFLNTMHINSEKCFFAYVTEKPCSTYQAISVNVMEKSNEIALLLSQAPCVQTANH